MKVQTVGIVCFVLAIALCGSAGAVKMQVPDFANATIVTNLTILLEDDAAYRDATPLPNASYSVSAATGDKPQIKSILPYISYDAWERNQNPTGTCWVWAATANLEASLGYRMGYLDRLSIQYFVSGYNSGGTTGPYAGHGGTMEKFAAHYNTVGIAIPWSNNNARWQDAAAGVPGDTGPTSVPLALISTDPHYHLNGAIKPHRVRTYYHFDGVSQQQAVDNIKGLIDVNRPVIFAFNGDNSKMFDSWFANFWVNAPKSDLLDFSLWGYNHRIDKMGGHAVVIVGYSDYGPGSPDSYWVCLNSWGNRTNRPDGTFRLKMYQDYNVNKDGGEDYPLMRFWSLDFQGYLDPVAFINDKPPKTVEFTADSVAGTVQDYTCKYPVTFHVTDWGYPTSGVIYYGDGEEESVSYTPDPDKSVEQKHTFVHAYPPGIFTPTYYSTNGVGLSEGMQLGDITVTDSGQPPSPNFRARSTIYYCPDRTDPPTTFHVHFYSEGGRIPTSCTWDFGDGSPPLYDIYSPGHIYTKKGQYTVTLTMQNAYGTGVKQKKIDVRLEPVCLYVNRGAIENNTRYHAWDSFNTVEVPPKDRYSEIMLASSDIVVHPVSVSSTKAEKLESFPAEFYDQFPDYYQTYYTNEAEAVPAAMEEYGGVFTPVPSGDAGPDLILPKPTFTKPTFKLKPGVNKTVKAFVNTNGMKPGHYTFDVVVKDEKTRAVQARQPMYFSIRPAPKIVVTPASINAGTLEIGGRTRTDFYVENKGNVFLNCTLQAPPEYLFGSGVGAPIKFTVPPGVRLLGTFRIDTKFRAQQGTDRSKFSGMTIESNDPYTPVLEIPVTYTVDAPEAQLVSMNIPDAIYDAGSEDVFGNITLKNVGRESWSRTFRLGVPDFGDAGLFLSGIERDAGVVKPGQTATYDVILHPLGDPEAYGDYVLAFEMYYTDEHGEKVFFGSPVFKRIFYGAAEEPSPTVLVTVPNGGESWVQGSAHDIIWTQTGLTGTNVKIDLYRQRPAGIHQIVIADSVPASAGTFSWTVPYPFVGGDDFWVNISSLSYPSVYDATDGWLSLTIPET